MRAVRSHNRRAGHLHLGHETTDPTLIRAKRKRKRKKKGGGGGPPAHSRLTQSHQREIYVLKFQGLIYECRGSKSLGIAASIAPATNLFLFLAGYRVTPTHYPRRK